MLRNVSFYIRINVLCSKFIWLGHGSEQKIFLILLIFTVISGVKLDSSHQFTSSVDNNTNNNMFYRFKIINVPT